jgi:hypothetical protein
MAAEEWTFDPTRLPRRLTLELDPRVFDRLQSVSAETGRCIDELALQCIDRALQASGSTD